MEKLKIKTEIPDDMEIIDGMPASKPQNAGISRNPWEE